MSQSRFLCKIKRYRDYSRRTSGMAPLIYYCHQFRYPIGKKIMLTDVSLFHNFYEMEKIAFTPGGGKAAILAAHKF